MLDDISSIILGGNWAQVMSKIHEGGVDKRTSAPLSYRAKVET